MLLLSVSQKDVLRNYDDQKIICHTKCRVSEKNIKVVIVKKQFFMFGIFHIINFLQRKKVKHF